jgi:hypothetical protein
MMAPGWPRQKVRIQLHGHLSRNGLAEFHGEICQEVRKQAICHANAFVVGSLYGRAVAFYFASLPLAWGLVSSDKRTIFRVIMPPFADHTLCDHNNCEAKHIFWELQHGLYQKFLCSLQQKCIHGKLPGNQDGSSGMV